MPAPSLCVVSGVVYDENGVPAVGVTLYLTKVLLNGVLIGAAPIGSASIPGPTDHNVFYIEAITSDAVGAVSFTVPQLSTVYLEGNVSGYNNGEVALSIPATANSTLEALTPATFPIDVTTFTFLSLVDTPNDFTGQALKNVRVNAAGTALEFAAPVVVDNETVQDALTTFFPADVVTYDDAGNQVLFANATAAARGLMTAAYAARLDQLEVGDSPTFAGANLTGQLLTGDGTAAAPAFSFTSQPTQLGFFRSGTNAIDVALNGVGRLRFNDATGMVIAGTYFLGWGSSGLLTPDVSLARRGVNALRVGNGGVGSGQLLIGSSTDTIAAQLHTLSNAIGVIPFIAEGPAGLTANIFEGRVNGTSKVNLDANGGARIGIGATANDFILIGGTTAKTITINSNALGAHCQLIGDTTGGGGPSELRFGSGALVTWRSTARADTGSNDLSLTRNAANILQVGDGAANANGKMRAAEYQVAAIKVIGAQGAAVADATDNPSAITQLNALLARLRAHGLIAT